jgi:hypothetical protein
MNPSTSPDPISDPLHEILAVLRQIEEHMAAIRRAFVPANDVRHTRFDYNKERL